MNHNFDGNSCYVLNSVMNHNENVHQLRDEKLFFWTVLCATTVLSLFGKTHRLFNISVFGEQVERLDYQWRLTTDAPILCCQVAYIGENRWPWNNSRLQSIYSQLIAPRSMSFSGTDNRNRFVAFVRFHDRWSIWTAKSVFMQTKKKQRSI